MLLRGVVGTTTVRRRCEDEIESRCERSTATSFETPHADITGSFENEQLGDPPAMPGMRSRGFAAERSHGQW